MSVPRQVLIWIWTAACLSAAPSHCHRRCRHHHHGHGQTLADPAVWGSSVGSVVALEAWSGCPGSLRMPLIGGTNILASCGRTFVLQAVGFDKASNDATLPGAVPNHEFPKRLFGGGAYAGACLRHTANRPFVRNVCPCQPQSSDVRREAQNTVARLDKERCRYGAEGANWLLLSGHLHAAVSGVDWARREHAALEQ